MAQIYLRNGRDYVAMSERQYEQEKVLQDLIEQHPALLTEEGGRLILVRREAGVSQRPDGSARWSLDHLYLDESATPTLVEVKRSTDTRSRREVVAQMLDYAAHASISFDAETLAGWLDELARADPRPEVQSADDLLREDLGIQSEDVEDYWQEVDAKLKAEQFRLIFVADRIGRILRRIIEFLNSQMTDTEVLAIEVKQYTDSDGRHQTIVPTVVGDTARARQVKKPSRGRRRRLGREELLSGFEELGPESRAAAEGLLQWAEQHPRLRVRFTATGCSIRLRGTRRSLVKLWVREPERSLEVPVGALAEADSETWTQEAIQRLMEDLAAIGVNLDGRGDRGWRWPKGPIAALSEEEPRRRFTELLEERTLPTLLEA